MANKGLGVRRKIFIGAGVFALLLGILYVHLAVYPFWSDHPNFSDVERVFDRIQFPEDWKITESGEDRGIAGRTCPLEGSGCFSKFSTFEIPKNTDSFKIENAVKAAGCSSVISYSSSPDGADPYTDYSCSVGGINIVASTKEGGASWLIRMSVRTY